MNGMPGKHLYNLMYNKIIGDVMKVFAQARAIGGSLVVTIPRQIVKNLNIRPNEQVAVDFEKPNKTGFGILKGMRPFTREDEMTGHD